ADLQSVSSLEPIIEAVRSTAAEVVPTPRSTLGHVPLLVKIAPDLADDDVLDICDLALRTGVDGLITTSTTIDRSVLAGSEAACPARQAAAFCGHTLADRALYVLRRVNAHVGQDVTVISVGVDEDANDARARVTASVGLVQVYSEMIYTGPFFPCRVIR